MTKYSDFKTRLEQRKIVADKAVTGFMFDGNSATEIAYGDIVLQGAIVNRQEKDYAYVFFPLATDITAGEMVSSKGLNFLLTEEIVMIKEVEFRKFMALICNAEINGSWGYFRGPEQSYINLALREDTVVLSQQKPVLVLKQGVINAGEKIVIKGRPWMVIESDLISNDFVGYYSLEATTMSKPHTDPPIAGKRQQTEEMPVLPASQVVVLTTEAGYFKTDKKVKLIKLSETAVEFEIPYGIAEIAVTTQADGKILETKYKVVI